MWWRTRLHQIAVYWQRLVIWLCLFDRRLNLSISADYWSWLWIDDGLPLLIIRWRATLIRPRIPFPMSTVSLTWSPVCDSWLVSLLSCLYAFPQIRGTLWVFSMNSKQVKPSFALENTESVEAFIDRDFSDLMFWCSILSFLIFDFSMRMTMFKRVIFVQS